MKYAAPVFIVAGLAAMLLGCSSQESGGKAKPGVDYTLVKLNVPKMV